MALNLQNCSRPVSITLKKSEKLALKLCLSLIDIGVFNALDMPVRICDELEGRLEAAGFVNRVLNVTPLPVNHDGKRGESLWYVALY